MITEEFFMAYIQCPYKVYCFLYFREKAIPNEYATILESEKAYSIKVYINQLKKSRINVREYSREKLFCSGANSLTNAALTFENFSAFCPVLIKSKNTDSYEPIIFTGQYTISKQDQLELFYIGYLLAQIQRTEPLSGKIITRNNKARNIKLTGCTQKTNLIIKTLAELINQSETEPPVLILNKNCGYCEFEAFCKATAKEQDALSLLHGISTKKAISKYEKKGIFTIKQLSYLYKPRKQKKRARTKALLHKFELQALAIRMNKIYLLKTPDITRQSIEIFLDIEGVPDQNFYYLIGLVIYEDDKYHQYSFWADTSQDEEAIFKEFITKINEYSKSSIYHYGSYENKAIKQLGERYDVDTKVIQGRMVNLNHFIYGKIYFPVYSNSLKDIATFIGFTWSSQNASGLQSIVWRHYWNKTQEPKYKKLLCNYNKDDCYALKVLVDVFLSIKCRSDVVSDLEQSIRGTRCPSKTDDVLHQQLHSVLKLSYLGYDKNKIKFLDDTENKKDSPTKRSKQKKKENEPLQELSASVGGLNVLNVVRRL